MVLRFEVSGTNVGENGLADEASKLGRSSSRQEGEEGFKESECPIRPTQMAQGCVRSTYSIEEITSLFLSMTRFWTRVLRVSGERIP